MRRTCVLLHRYVGLLMVPFLVVTGLSGAVIAWDHELDDALNPRLMRASSKAPPIASLELARRIEARDARVRVNYLPLVGEAGRSLTFGVQPRLDPKSGMPYAVDYNQVFVDPGSGVELGRRQWGAVWPVTRENFVSFLYKLHYSLHFPELRGNDRWGVWLLGAIAALWTIDCCVAVVLTFPAPRRRADDTARPSWWRRWRPSWTIRRGAGRYKLNFDLHRALSLWTWIVLITLAFTGFSLNLYREAFLPLLSRVSQLTATPFDAPPRGDALHPLEARVGFSLIVDEARAEGRRRGWPRAPGSVFYAAAWGVYSVEFFAAGEEHGNAGVGPQRLYYSGEDGRLLGAREAWHGTAADLFVQAQFPLHSGRLFGLPGRILVSSMGVVVALLALTGTVIWWRKRAGRRGRTGVATRRDAQPLRTIRMYNAKDYQ